MRHSQVEKRRSRLSRSRLGGHQRGAIASSAPRKQERDRIARRESSPPRRSTTNAAPMNGDRRLRRPAAGVAETRARSELRGGETRRNHADSASTANPSDHPDAR
jgi:hypothetical protein